MNENEWPLARTQWTKFYLEPGGRGLQREAPAAETSIAYETTGDGVTFYTPPLEQPLEITGPVACKLFLSSATNDADVFVVLRVFDPAGIFETANTLHFDAARRPYLLLPIIPPK